MKDILLFLFFIISSFSITWGQNTIFRTEALSDDIHTIQVNAGGNWQRQPVIELRSNDFIRINFDRLGDDSSNSLRYRIVNCNADWTQSSLSDIEFIDGFNNTLIEDYAYSINTSVHYTNFMFDLPNDRIRIKLSGNYAAEVFDEDDPSTVLMRACFSVLDPQVQIEGGVSSVTDIDSNREHQQVSFFINYNNLSVRDVFSDLKVYVRQNNRLDNQKSLIKPTSVQGNKLVYDHNRNLIFEAGNEYRRFESVSYRYNGLNVQNTEYRRPNYYTNINPDKIRAKRVYSYDRDQNGRFVIRNAEAADSNTEADYFITNFRLPASDPFLEPIYINGNFTDNTFDDRYLMVYDYDKAEYYGSVLLKQGAYNY
ncbi:DUF5103 domain-containing protein, partial [Dysgonomonas sp. OttesenSCG-928-M03]|nr:DUF5103 domain-containing protein [Dysgonomonas sp. OttesenSCG-928-M03]